MHNKVHLGKFIFIDLFDFFFFGQKQVMLTQINQQMKK